MAEIEGDSAFACLDVSQSSAAERALARRPTDRHQILDLKPLPLLELVWLACQAGLVGDRA